jgi:uncharacterized protein with GYD domain
MPTYIALMKLTEQGIKNIKNAPQRVEAARKGIEATGGKMTGFLPLWGSMTTLRSLRAPATKAP